MNRKEMYLVLLMLILNLVCIIPLLFFFLSLAVGVTTKDVSITLTDLQGILMKVILFMSTILIFNILLRFIYVTITNPTYRNPFRKRITIGEEMKEQ